jgi:hypothetical protein
MPSADEKIAELLTNLQREYDITAARRSTLTSQAANLTGFAGIIEAILVALLVGVSTDVDTRDLLTQSDYYPILFTFTVIGFVSYSVAVVIALFAYWESKWIPAPTIPKVDGRTEIESLNFFLANPLSYKSAISARQLKRGTQYNKEINALKYKLLSIAQVALIVGIVASAGIGITFLRIITPP